MIESRDNPRIKRIRRLMKKPKERRTEGRFIMEGIKAVREACRQGLAEEIYLSSETDADDFWGECPVETVDARIFQEISDTVTPQGVLAVVRIPTWDEDELVSRKNARWLCLEDVRDPGNIGTMIRTAEGAGMDAVLCSAGCADIYQPKVVRSTMGSVLRVPCLICASFEKKIINLQEKGFTIYASHLSSAKDYRTVSYSGRVGILIGNEAAGLGDRVTALADQTVKIPMAGEVESLNAAVAAALLMYETTKK